MSKPETGYCIQEPSGVIRIETIRYQRKTCIDKWLEPRTSATDWEAWKYNGWRCVKVTVSAVAGNINLPIKNEAQYKKALARFEEIFQSKKGKKSKEANELSDRIRRYEQKRWPFKKRSC